MNTAVGPIDENATTRAYATGQNVRWQARTKVYLGLWSLLALLVGQWLYATLVQAPGWGISLVFTLLMGIHIGLLLRIFNREWLHPLRQLNEQAGRLANSQPSTDVNGAELAEMAHHLRQIDCQLQEATHFARSIGEGKYDSQLRALTTEDGLGKALSEMRLQLQRVADDEGRRNWTVTGMAQLGELLRTHQQSSLSELSSTYIRSLVRYLGANQGSLFLMNEEQTHDRYIELVACYAYDKKKYEEKRIELGQGLVGRCMLESGHIYMTEVPAHYVRITSGLGEATPRNILLMPIRSGGQTYGAIEIACFSLLQPYQIQFVEKACESFASVVTGVKTAIRTQRLLSESQQSASALLEKEEVLHQNAQELMATQEELARKIAEIENESALTASIVEAINKTNASLELDMDGCIMAVNDMYLSLMEYTREELLGKSEKYLVAQDELISDRYEMMWSSIRSGAFNSGEYRRVSKSGRELWLTGTYSPINDVHGKTYKIIQFAQFTTEQKEKELELSSKINSINQCIPLLEMTMEGVIITTNYYFMNEFGFKRSDIRNLALTNLLDSNFSASGEWNEWWHTLQEGQVLTRSLKFKTKDGEDRYFIGNFSPTKNLAGQVNKILLALIDTTQEQRLREQLKLLLVEEKRKNALLELQAETTDEFVDKLGDIVLQLEEGTDHSAMDNLLRDKKIPVIELDQKGKIIFVNNGIQKILGVEEARLVGAPVNDFLHFVSEEEKQLFHSRIRTPVLSQMKVRFVLRQGQVLTFNLFITPRFNYTHKQDFFTVLLLMMNVEPVLEN